MAELKDLNGVLNFLIDKDNAYTNGTNIILMEVLPLVKSLYWRGLSGLISSYELLKEDMMLRSLSHLTVLVD